MPGVAETAVASKNLMTPRNTRAFESHGRRMDQPDRPHRRTSVDDSLARTDDSQLKASEKDG
jgi:hypothetical protein